MPHIDEVRQKVAFEYVNRDAPSSATDIATQTVYVTKVRVHNRTSGALTITIKDRSGTAVEKYTAISIAANSVVLEVSSEFPETYTDGINLVASATGLSVTIEGYKEPS